jgi:hypothetical protein
MSNSVLPPETFYDLEAESRAQARSERSVQIAGPVVGLMLCVAGFYFLLRPPSNVQATSGFYAVFGFITGGGVFAVVAFLLYFPLTRVRSLRIGPSGVDIGYSPGRFKHINWKASRGMIRLEDWRDLYSRYPALARRSGIIWDSPGPRMFDISPMAYTALLSAMRQVGWAINETTFDIAAPSGKATVHRVTCKPTI